MVLGLKGIRPKLCPAQDQILASPTVLSLEDVFARMLCVYSLITVLGSPFADSSVLASHTSARGEHRGGQSGNSNRANRPKCNDCYWWGHTRENCHKLHGQPPRAANVVQTVNLDS